MMANTSYANNAGHLNGGSNGTAASGNSSSGGVSGSSSCAMTTAHDFNTARLVVRDSNLSSMLLTDWNGASSMLPYALEGSQTLLSSRQATPQFASNHDLANFLTGTEDAAAFSDTPWPLMARSETSSKGSSSAANYYTEHDFARRQVSASASPPLPASARQVNRASPSTSSVRSGSADGAAAKASAAAATQKKRKRKQNQSCDQCRNSKRACNLSSDLAGPCSTCLTRQLDCSTEWLRSRRTSKGMARSDKHDDDDDDADDGMDGAEKRSSALHRLATRLKQEETSHGLALVSRNNCSGRQTPIPTLMFGLVKDAMGAHVKRCKLRIYLGVLEHPFSHWLGNGCSPHMHGLEIVQGSMPAPQQNVLTPFMHLTTGVLTTMSDSSTGPRKPIQPMIVQALGLLDAFLLVNSMQRRGVDLNNSVEDSPRWRSIRQTNRDIDDALTWALIANSCQFSGGGELMSQSGAGWQDFDKTQAIALWEMARSVLFKHVSSNSFRIAFAFVIFGITTPPRWDETGSSQPQPSEDVVFATGHGVRTIRKQCLFVKQVLNSLHFESGLPRDAEHDASRAFVWPLGMHAPITTAANALSWFCDLAEAAIGTVMKRCRVYQYERESLDVDEDLRSNNILDALTAQMSAYMTPDGVNGVNRTTEQFFFSVSGEASKNAGAVVSFNPSPLPDFSLELGPSWKKDSPWKQIWLRAHQDNLMVSVYGQCAGGSGTSADGALDILQCGPHSVLSRLRNGSAFKALLWKVVADLEPFLDGSIATSNKVHDAVRFLNAHAVARELASQWYVLFHGFIESAMQAYASLAPEEKTMLAFLVHHIHLAFFYLDDLNQRALLTCFDPQMYTAASEAAQIAVLRERFIEAIKHRREYQRVEDAKFIAYMCEHAHLNMALNNAISADHAEAELDAELIQSKPMGQWGHPFPPILIQAQAFATDALLSEAEMISLELLNATPSPSTAQRQAALFDLLKHADNCLFSLSSLQQAMFAFPSHALSGQVQLPDLQRRRAALSM